MSRAGYDSTPEEDPTRDSYTVVLDPRPTANVTIAGHSVMGVALKPYGLPGPQHGERGHRSRRLLLPGAASLVAALCLAAALAAFLVHPADAQSGDEASSPSHLTAVIADGEVILNWSSPAHDAASVTGYEILRRQRPKEGEIARLILVADTGSTATTYTDATANEPGTRYTYRVKALRGSAKSARSNAARVDVAEEVDQTAPPPTPALRGVTVQPSDAQAETCPGGVYNPSPTAVDVTAVPIVVASTTSEYFVLYAKHEVAGTELELPVLVKKGAAGTTTLAENVEALPADRYRVEKYLIADPADVDGDCTDDITELGDPVGMNPVNPAPAIALNDGAVAVPDRVTWETYSFTSISNKSFLKYVLFGLDTERPGVYFQHTQTYRHHRDFLSAIGLARAGVTTGQLVYDPALVASDGSLGVYYYANELASNPFGIVALTHSVIAASMPLIEGNLALHFLTAQLPDIQDDLALYEASRINVLFDSDVYSGIDFLALNPGEGYGRLQALEPDDRPLPRDIVLYEALPNELPRVAGIISTVPQTPLSHVNLRAVQNGIPNAYIRDIRDDPAFAPLIGSYVRYEVTEDGYLIRAATRAEVDAHYEASRPDPQTPERDLSVTAITPLSEIGFDDWLAFGVKAANVAVLRTLDFPEGTVPDGFAIPFYFYDEFMKAHGFYDRIEQMLADPDFQSDFDVQDDMLDDLRDDIKDADSPQWILDALTTMHASFPDGTSLRYRSSTNNEDLPGFNGAGLYDSKTQDPDETAEDGIDKSLKGVFASLWNFRAFTERDFHRIDHTVAAMGVLVHPNYSDELANGVAVSFDPTDPTSSSDWYYVNTQIGEDLVTNPEAHSVPEEILLYRGGYIVVSTSNLVEPGKLLMSDSQLIQLRDHLTTIHAHFEALYNPGPSEPFAMEIEFKITSDDILSIKQARPWVFGDAPTVVEPPVTPAVRVGFAASSYTVAEGESVSVVVSLNVDPERILTIPLTPRGQGGASSADHSGIPASVTFASGVTSQMFDVNAAADDEADAGESVWIGFGALPAGVTVGATPVTTVAITDSDDPPVDPPVTVIPGGGGGGGPSGPTPSEIDFEWNVTRDLEELDRDHDDPTGMWSDGATLWLAHNGDGADDAVYAYDLESGERVEDREFELDAGNLAPRGIWSDGERAWVSDSGQERLFAYDLATGERLDDRDIELAEANADARGIWSDGQTMWVLDGNRGALFAYDLASGELLAEYALHDDNDDPHGVFSDGVTVWVSDHNDKRLFAYRLPAPEGPAAEDAEALELERVTDEEFDKLSGASNNSPRGLWSVGDVMYVADASDGKVYSYNMPDAVDARLASLTLSGVDIGEFDSGQREYTGAVGDGVTETTVGAEAAQPGATVVVEPDDDDPENGHQVALEDVSEITVTVTSRDESRERVYRVLVGDPGQEAPDGPAPPCFRGAVALGFSLVVYAGGSVEELVDCAQSRHGTALYTLHDGGYVPYILGVPEFVNSSFGELFAGGVPASTPLIIKSEGPPTADPAGSITGDDPTPPWPECLRGTVATGFSLVLYEGGAIEELVACAESSNITAIYTLHDGGYVPHILGAPDFVNRSFRALFTGGVPATSPLIVKSDGVSAAAAATGAP